jgi:hypothetical protein
VSGEGDRDVSHVGHNPFLSTTSMCSLTLCSVNVCLLVFILSSPSIFSTFSGSIRIFYVQKREELRLDLLSLSLLLYLLSSAFDSKECTTHFPAILAQYSPDSISFNFLPESGPLFRPSH